MKAGRTLLLVAAWLSFLLAVLHVGMIAVGAPAYRYFGAGELMVRLAEQGSWFPSVVTAGATVLFTLAGAYALSAAGRLPRMAFVRLALVCIVAVYTLRGLFLFAQLAEPTPTRELVFSAVSLSVGLVYAAALTVVWSRIPLEP